VVDDADDIAELITLFGAMYLDCLGRLEKLRLLMKDGPIQNLGLILGIMCSLGDGWDVINDNKETAWTDEIGNKAKEKGIEMLDVTYKIEPYQIQDHKDPPEEDKDDKDDDKEEEEEEEEQLVYDFLEMVSPF
jgi:hypothetical protein